MEGVFAEMLKTIQEASEPSIQATVGAFDLGQPDRRPRPGAYFGRHPGACTPAFRSSIRRVRERWMLRSTYRSSFLSITRRSPCRSLVEWIDRVARGEGLSYEVILVDDGSGDGSWRVIENLHERFAAVRGSSSLATTANPPPCIAVSLKRAARWFSRWTPTCRTRRMRFRLCGVWSSTKGTTWCRAGKRSATTRPESGGRASFQLDGPHRFGNPAA